MNIHDALYVACRRTGGPRASPTACVIDSQRCEGRGKRGALDRSAGIAMPGKKIEGKNRHVLVDTLGPDAARPSCIRRTSRTVMVGLG